MSEAHPNAVAWDKGASPLAIQAVSEAENVANTISAAEAIERAAHQRPEGMTTTHRQSEVAHDPAHGITDELHSLLSLASDSLGGVQSLQQCVSGMVGSVICVNLRLVQEMFLVESPRALGELQQRFLREYFEAFQQGAAVLIQAARQCGEQATGIHPE